MSIHCLRALYSIPLADRNNTENELGIYASGDYLYIPYDATSANVFRMLHTAPTRVAMSSMLIQEALTLLRKGTTGICNVAVRHEATSSLFRMSLQRARPSPTKNVNVPSGRSWVCKGSASLSGRGIAVLEEGLKVVTGV
jgi:hypothetical protein